MMIGYVIWLAPVKVRRFIYLAGHNGGANIDIHLHIILTPEVPLGHLWMMMSFMSSQHTSTTSIITASYN